MTYKDFSKLQAELDGVAIITRIHRSAPKNYEVHINGQITRVYRKRISAKRNIVRIYNKQFNAKVKQ